MGKKGECWGIRGRTSSIDGNPAASHQPCQEAGNNTTCLFGSHRYLHMVLVFPLQISRFRLEMQLVKSTGEINIKQESPSTLLCGQKERQPGTLSRHPCEFYKSFSWKTLSWPLGCSKVGRLSCKLALCHSNRWPAAQAAKRHVGASQVSDEGEEVYRYKPGVCLSIRSS